MYNTPTNHDMAQVQISLDNNVKWSSQFPFLFINWLKIACDRRAYLWSDLDLGCWPKTKLDYALWCDIAKM